MPIINNSVKNTFFFSKQEKQSHSFKTTYSLVCATFIFRGHTAAMPANIIYSDLSAYYDVLCADIDYQTQSAAVLRLHQLFGNGGKNHLDLACGTGPHIRYFLDNGFNSSGLDINQAMLDLAQQRCPESQFTLQDMANFSVAEPVDLISCFLYSIHYNRDLTTLKRCIESVYHALKPHGIFCFNSVDKHQINNQLSVSHSANLNDEALFFQSSWYYSGEGEQQALKLRIEKATASNTQIWHDEHTMVAGSFAEIQSLLAPYFEVIALEHAYEKITPLSDNAGNALFVCIKQS